MNVFARRILAAWAAIFLVGSPLIAQELRWKLKAGESLLAKIEQKSEVASSIGGAAPTLLTLETALELGWSVQAVDDQGLATISQKFKRLRMKLEMPKSGAISYDSASETKPSGDAKAIAAALEPLLEAEAKLTLTPRAEIKNVELDDAAQKVAASLEANPALKAVLSKEGQTNLLRQTLVVLPEGAVKPGESWSRTTPLATALGNLKQTTTFKLLEPEAKSPDLARIESVSTLELEGPPSKTRPATLKNQHQTGTILFDAAAGRLRSAEIEQELVTTSILKDTPIQVTLTSSLKMTLDDQ
jgi:hypothetical protein